MASRRIPAPWRAALMIVLLSAPGFFASCRRGEKIARLTVTPSSLTLRHGQCIPLRFRWEPAAPLDRREGTPSVFVHLLDGPHSLVRTFDHPLQFAWKPGREQSYEIDLCQSAMTEPLAVGTYRLKVGLYDDVIGYRWPLEANGEETRSRGYEVARVVVAANEDRIPAFSFEGDWPRPETLTDKQILVRRALLSTGVLRIQNVTRPGVVRLAFRVSGKPASPLVIAGSCAKSPVTIGTEGIRVVELPLTGPCEIAFTPPPTTTVYLESVAWKEPAVSAKEMTR